MRAVCTVGRSLCSIRPPLSSAQRAERDSAHSLPTSPPRGVVRYSPCSKTRKGCRGSQRGKRQTSQRGVGTPRAHARLPLAHARLPAPLRIMGVPTPIPPGAGQGKRHRVTLMSGKAWAHGTACAVQGTPRTMARRLSRCSRPRLPTRQKWSRGVGKTGEWRGTPRTTICLPLAG